MKLSNADIRTREVLDWKGLHLFHAHASSCSQKVRIFLNLKAIPWQSHPINISANENISAFYLGINPRGLVPTIVHDGAVHIESNDILTYLEGLYPDPPLIPAEHREEISRLLRHEDDLHLALRTVSFRFLLAPEKPPKSTEDLERYATLGSGTIGGVEDKHLDQEIGFWQQLVDGGISDGQAREAVAAFRTAFEALEDRLSDRAYFMGDRLSVLDIAWVIYVNRLKLAGYPLARLHPHLSAWAEQLKAHPALRDELALPPHIAAMVAASRRALEATGGTLEVVCDLG